MCWSPGYHVDALVAQELKERTNSEFLFLTPGGVIASTLNPRATRRWSRYPRSKRRPASGQRWRDGVCALR